MFMPCNRSVSVPPGLGFTFEHRIPVMSLSDARKFRELNRFDALKISRFVYKVTWESPSSRLHYGFINDLGIPEAGAGTRSISGKACRGAPSGQPHKPSPCTTWRKSSPIHSRLSMLLASLLRVRIITLTRGPAG